VEQAIFDHDWDKKGDCLSGPKGRGRTSAKKKGGRGGKGGGNPNSFFAWSARCREEHLSKGKQRETEG